MISQWPSKPKIIVFDTNPASDPHDLVTRTLWRPYKDRPQFDIWFFTATHQCRHIFSAVAKAIFNVLGLNHLLVNICFKNYDVCFRTCGLRFIHISRIAAAKWRSQRALMENAQPRKFKNKTSNRRPVFIIDDGPKALSTRTPFSKEQGFDSHL